MSETKRKPVGGGELDKVGSTMRVANYVERED